MFVFYFLTFTLSLYTFNFQFLKAFQRLAFFFFFVISGILLGPLLLNGENNQVLTYFTTLIFHVGGKKMYSGFELT